MWKIKNFFCVLLLIASTHAATLMCNFNGSPTSPCNSFTLSPVTQINEEILVPGAPFSPYKDSTPLSINFNAPEFTIQEWPNRLFEIFTSVYSFNVQNISMSELPTDAFHNCEVLNSIYITISNLGNIRAGFASSCFKVNSFYVFDSKIQSIDGNAFYGMESLNNIYISNSGLTCLPPTLFYPTKGLEYLELSGNKLTAIHSQAFFGLIQLSYVNLAGNQISYIPNWNLDTTRSVLYNKLNIMLNSNPIAAINPLLVTSLNEKAVSFNYNVLIDFNVYKPNITTCAAGNGISNNLFFLGDPNFVAEQNAAFATTCYAAFTAEMETDSLVTCGSDSSFITTTTFVPGNSNDDRAILRCLFDGSHVCQYPQLMSVTKPNQEISVPGAPYVPFSDNLTTTLNLDGFFAIQYWPTNIFGIFTNLGEFSIKNIIIPELSTNAFYNCETLSLIQITRCNLGNIRAGFASNCVMVREFYVFDSKIQSIDGNAFYGMESLNNIYISNSGLTCLPPTLFYPTKGLEYLDLSSNKLTAIHSQAFVGLTQLYYVNLAGNQISYIPNWNLDTTRSVLYNKLNIMLNSNPIAAINPLLVTSLNEKAVSFNYNVLIDFTVYELNITTCATGNGISSNLFFLGDSNFLAEQNAAFATTCYAAFTAEMESDSLVTCGSVITTTEAPTLSSGGSTSSSGGSGSSSGSGTGSGQCATDKICRYYLDWNNTYTCVIDGAEGTVTSISGTHYLSFTNADLKRLYFINSHLSVVPSILFDTFPNLMYLHVANSGLSVINDKTFNKCGNLELLDASHNGISHVEETALRNCTKLRVIDLTGNPIDYVGGDLYQLDPSLERIHLHRLDDWILA